MKTTLGMLSSAALSMLVAGNAIPDSSELTPETYARVSRAVVYIKVDRIYHNYTIHTGGTGFFVSPRGHVLTNWHVVAPQLELEEDYKQVEISTMLGSPQVVVGSGMPGEIVLEPKVVALDRKRDLALLQISHQPSQWIEPTPVDHVDVMAPLWVAGFPFGEALALNKKNPEVTVTSGRVSALRNNDKGQPEGFQLDAAVNPGNSGGPVVNPPGQLLGVIRAGVPGGTGTSLAIAPSLVREFVQANQFRIDIDPIAILALPQQCKVTLSPRLASASGLAARVTVRYKQAELVSTRGSEQAGTIALKLDIPKPPGEEEPRGDFELAIALTSSDGKVVFERTVTLSNQIEKIKPLESQRHPSEMMRDRMELGNRMESSEQARKAGDGSRETGEENLSPLSRLAKNVKLKQEGGEPSMTNSSMLGGSFRPVEAHYAHLDSEQRATAERLDALAAACPEVLREYSRVSSTVHDCGSVLRTPVPDYDYRAENYKNCNAQRYLEPKVRECQWSVMSLKKKANTLGICRCQTGVWFPEAAAPCDDCSLPRLE